MTMPGGIAAARPGPPPPAGRLQRANGEPEGMSKLDNRFLPLRSKVSGAVQASQEMVNDRPVVVARFDPRRKRGALTPEDGNTLSHAASMARSELIPLVLVGSSSGVSVHEGVAALHGWGQAARAMATCSGIVPILALVTGPAVSGPALMLGLADAVVMTADACCYISGPDMVSEITGVSVDASTLGGVAAHSRLSGVCALEASGEEDGWQSIAELLSYLPSHAGEEAPRLFSDDPLDRKTPELFELLPRAPTGSYDVRALVAAIADPGTILELRARWAPQLVTMLARIGGLPVGILANQPQSLAGTLDIAASQKGAGFVRFCDAFNLSLLTVVDTPGFMPGKDLEWRGMIRHGAELAFAYAEATVPRVSLIVRKAYGGAYIVMDSKGLGNDLCLAWPTAEIAVMGAKGAAQILYRNASAPEREELEHAYEAELLTPWTAAERGYVDSVIDPEQTRYAISTALQVLSSKQEKLVQRKHANGPL
ncbi:MAG: methylmalonyl-CoA carboxyltransferase [Actinobacteria bacterium]|nr:methylmalonyl-CoA carboxyltransferase [Actinomycetota bacterium]